MSDEYDIARALRVAMAQAWDEGHRAGSNDIGSGLRDEELTKNPYRENQ